MFNVRFTIWLVALLVLMGSAMTASFECRKGVPYEQNRCNSCTCNDGSLSCTSMECSGVAVPTCDVGSATQEACNMCHCTADWGYVCTNYNCHERVRSNHYSCDWRD